MALPVEHATFSKDILELVRQTDLSCLTSKFVRNKMEEKHHVKLGEFRKQIDEVIRDSIERIESDKNAKSKSEVKPQNGSATNNNSRKREASPPPKVEKKARKDSPKREVSPPLKIEKKVVKSPKNGTSPPKIETQNSFGDLSFDDDNDIYSAVKRRRAAQRPTIQRKPQTKKAKKTKEGGAKRETAFTRVCVLSDELAEVLSRKYMRRSDVVKQMWVYIKEKDLYDPKDRRYVIFDDRLKAALGTNRIKAFGMMKILKNHIKDLDFLDDDSRRTALHEIELLEESGELDLNRPSTSNANKSVPIEDSDSSDSSNEEKKVKEVPVTVKPKAAIKSKAAIKPKTTVKSISPQISPSTSPIPTNNNVAIDSPSTSKIEEPREEPRASKLILRISKKNDRVVSVKVNDDEDSNTPHVNSSTDNGVVQNVSSNASTTTDLEDGPPQLDLEVQENVASSSQSSSSSNSSGSSSGSTSSSAASSPTRNGATNNVVHKNLSLSESDSD